MRESGARNSPPVLPASADEHRIALAGGWEMWRTVCLRGTGFPVGLLDNIAASDGCRSIRDWLESEAAVEVILVELRDRCGVASGESDGDERRMWRRVLRVLKKRRIPDPIPGATEINLLFEKLNRALQQSEAHRLNALAQTARDRQATSEFLATLSAENRFREAVTWQNRQVIGRCLDVLARKSNSKRTAGFRYREDLIYSYLQRYCAKNDSIGFFGPLGWADVVDGEGGISVRPGEQLISDRHVYWEHWAIDKLAHALCQNKRVLPWLAPRLRPELRFAGPDLVGTDGRLMRLRPDISRMLACCDGKTPAIDIAGTLANDPTTEFSSRAQVLEALLGEEKKRTILWNAIVPVEKFPERSFRRKLESIKESEIRPN